MHGYIYVDTSLLYKGIYETLIPRLYLSETTIDSLITQCEDLYNKDFVSIEYFEAFKENISKCRLATAYLETYEN